MQSIKYNKENQVPNNKSHPSKTPKLRKTMCKISTHIRIKENEEANKVAKQAIDARNRPNKTTT